MVLTHTRGSLKYKDVTAAVQAIFPQGVAKAGNHKGRDVLEVLTEDGEEHDELEDGSEDVFQAVADTIQNQL